MRLPVVTDFVTLLADFVTHSIGLRLGSLTKGRLPRFSGRLTEPVASTAAQSWPARDAYG